MPFNEAKDHAPRRLHILFADPYKVYHRLTYGEYDTYRAIHCETPDGPREIHEFHLEEGEFAVVTPTTADAGESVLILHESQLVPILQLLEECNNHPSWLG